MSGLKGAYESTFLADLQRDSDCEGEIFLQPGEKIVVPFKKGLHFQRFIVKFRNTMDIEEIKATLSTFEKDALLLSLIPIAFNDDLELATQVNGLFTDQDDSLRTIWEFVLLSYRYNGIPEGLHKITYDGFLRLD